MKVLILLLLLTIHCISCYRSDNLCYKMHVCRGRFCGFSTCTGKYSFNCNKEQCSIDKATCNGYHKMIEMYDSKKSKFNYCYNRHLIKIMTFNYND